MSDSFGAPGGIPVMRERVDLEILIGAALDKDPTNEEEAKVRAEACLAADEECRLSRGAIDRCWAAVSSALAAE